MPTENQCLDTHMAFFTTNVGKLLSLYFTKVFKRQSWIVKFSPMGLFVTFVCRSVQ